MLPMPQIILSAVSVSPTLVWCIIGIAVFLLLYMACGYVKAPPNNIHCVRSAQEEKDTHRTCGIPYAAHRADR